VSQLVIIVLASWLAGVAAFIGGILAWIEGTAETEAKREMVHGVVAFGKGILIAAVAFALAPEGIAVLTPVALATTFFLGGLGFCVLDAHLSKRGGNQGSVYGHADGFPAGSDFPGCCVLTIIHI
jgi:ZIP family zinc transporter